jgi:hypothetical protein
VGREDDAETRRRQLQGVVENTQGGTCCYIVGVGEMIKKRAKLNEASTEDFEGEAAAEMSVSEDGKEVDDYDKLDSIGKPRTPSRKRKRVQTTPSQKTMCSNAFVQPTPHSKAGLARRQSHVFPANAGYSLSAFPDCLSCSQRSAAESDARSPCR